MKLVCCFVVLFSILSLIDSGQYSDSVLVKFSKKSRLHSSQSLDIQEKLLTSGGPRMLVR